MLAWGVQSASNVDGAGSALALLVLIAVIAAWLGARGLVRRLRARKTETLVHGAFAEFALHALANAAKLDGRVATTERAAILQAMHEIVGAGFESTRIDAALAGPALSKDELVAYLEERSRAFSREEKVKLLKALLGVFVADGRFDESEHHALIEYTAAVGFDRQSAPQKLRGLLSDMIKDKIT